jgi:signal transduction histidine kinase
MNNGAVEFSIRDNGKGFDVAAAAKSNTNGISGMRERLSLVGGKFEMSSSKEHGTIITARIPIVPPPSRDRQTATE